MSRVEKHLASVGVQTGNTMKLALFELLLSRYCTSYERETAEKLAACVVDFLFCEPGNHPEKHAFARENSDLIQAKAAELASDTLLCQALTCAIYNFSYGKFVESGRKVGFFTSPFIGFHRALGLVAAGRERPSFLDRFEEKVGSAAFEPLFRLWGMGLYTALPNTPDSTVMLEKVVAFERSVKSNISSRMADNARPANPVDPREEENEPIDPFEDPRDQLIFDELLEEEKARLDIERTNTSGREHPAK